MTNVQHLGIAFGTVHSLENVVLFALGLTVGVLRDSTNSFHGPLWCVHAVAMVGLLSSIAVVLCGPASKAPVADLGIDLDDVEPLDISADEDVSQGVDVEMVSLTPRIPASVR